MTIRQAIEQQIKAQDTTNNFREVAGAANLRGVLESRVSAPACYVFRLRNSAGANNLDRGVSQRVTESYAVVVVTGNRRDARGADSSDENEALCQQIDAALLNWTPDPNAEPLEYGGGSLVSIANGYMYWQDIYTTARFRRAL